MRLETLEGNHSTHHSEVGRQRFRVNTRSSRLNIRRRPSRTAGVVGALDRGTIVLTQGTQQVRVGRQTETWHQLSQGGWVSGAYLTPVSGREASPSSAAPGAASRRKRYPVPRYSQRGEMTCWLACLRMLAEYRHSRGRRLNPRAMMLLEPDFVRRFQELDRPIDGRQVETVGRGFGMSAIRIPGFTQRTPGGLVIPAGFDVLNRRGPFMFCGLRRGVQPHAIVINGWNGTSGTEMVEFVDPAQGRYQQIEFGRFAAGFPPLGDAPLLVF